MTKYYQKMFLFVLGFILFGTVIFVNSRKVVSADLNDEVIFKVSGKGIIPPGQEGTKDGKALGLRAAIVDAYRNMAEKIYGSKVIKKGNVTEESVSGLVAGAKVTKEECKGNNCVVELTLTSMGIFSSYTKIFNSNKNLINENTKLQKKIDELKKQNADLNKKLQNCVKKKCK